MSLLQSYLRNGGTLDDLKVKFAIDATRHKTYPSLVLLKYNQIESPFTEAIVREARGIILDEADNWAVKCMRFRKFANYGEGYAAPVDFATSKILEKVDGSLVTLFNYHGEWMIATSGSPDASGQVGDFPFTFAELFWRVWNKSGLKFPENTDLCPSFELMTPWNIVVVPHTTERLVFIGLHDRSTCQELPLDTMPHYPAVKSFAFNYSFAELLAYTKTLNGFEQEGFVLTDMANKRDDDFGRVKIKCDDYLAKHQLKSSWSIRRATEVVMKNEVGEIKTYFPAFAEQLDDIKARYDSLVETIHNDYERLKHHETQKAFALEAVKTACSGALFMLRAGKTDSVRAYLASINVDKVIHLLGLKDEDKNDPIEQRVS